MPYSINADTDYVRIILAGQLTVVEVVSAAAELDKIDAGPGPTLHRLVDITAVENLHVSFSEMSGFSSQRRHVKLKNLVRTAVVAKTPVQFGVGRMFEFMNAQPETQVAVFKDVDGAERWLRGEAEIKPSMI